MSCRDAGLSLRTAPVVIRKRIRQLEQNLLVRVSTKRRHNTRAKLYEVTPSGRETLVRASPNRDECIAILRLLAKYEHAVTPNSVIAGNSYADYGAINVLVRSGLIESYDCGRTYRPTKEGILYLHCETQLETQLATY